MAETILQVNHLKKTFENADVLTDISFQVRRGEVVVILGPSGCGKSTLLRCINGLEKADAGEILLNGEKISSDRGKMHLVRQKIGMVFQSYDLFPHKDVMGNLLLGPVKALGRKKQDVELEAIAQLKRVGLSGKEHALPRTLSGGQKQRVALVRALMMHPEILLLDEITAALDPEMVHEVLEVVLALAEAGSTMLIVTHEMAFARAIADRILFLEHGEIVEESDDPRRFFERPETDRARKFLHSFDYEVSGNKHHGE